MSFGRRRCTLDLSRYSSSRFFLPFDLVDVTFFTLFSPVDGKYALSDIRLGSRADSYYEYLL